MKCSNCTQEARPGKTKCQWCADVCKKYASSEKGKKRRSSWEKLPESKVNHNKRKKLLATSRVEKGEFAQPWLHGKKSMKPKVVITKVKRPRKPRKYKYGVTPEMRATILLDQGGVCKLCQEPFGTKLLLSDMVIDHCHITGKVRGLIHRRCNIGLGMFRDNEALLILALRYIRKSKES
jgi:hypothetical protein